MEISTEELIGRISAFIVFISILPYAYRVIQGKIIPNPVSWFVWCVASFALLANYKSSGAKENAWPAIMGCFNPSLVFLITVFKGKWEKLQWWDWVCLVLGLVSLGIWYKLGQNLKMAERALYVGIIADAFAAIPTLVVLSRKPYLDRPFAWVAFAIGYAVTMFAIREHTFNNYVLPVYMTLMALCIAYPLIHYRLRKGIPIKNWI